MFFFLIPLQRKTYTMGSDATAGTLVQRNTPAKLFANTEPTESNELTKRESASEHPNPSFQMQKDLHEVELQKLREIGAKTPILPSQIGTDLSFKRDIVWKNLIGFIVLHVCALYGILITFQNVPSYKTTIFCEYYNT